MAGIIKITGKGKETKVEVVNDLPPTDYHIIRIVKEAFLRLREKKFGGIKRVHQENLEILCREIATIEGLKVKEGRETIYEFSVTDITKVEVLVALVCLVIQEPETFGFHFSFIFFDKPRKE